MVGRAAKMGMPWDTIPASEAHGNHAAIVKLLLNVSASPSLTRYATAEYFSGYTALHYCAINQHMGAAQAILETDASTLEVRGSDGDPPLISASLHGSFEMV